MNTTFSHHTLAGVLSAIVGPNAAQSLNNNYHSLTDLCRATDDELLAHRNIGHARLAQIRGALELASRLSREVLGESPVLDNPERIADLMREQARQYQVEQFKVLLLNTRRRLIRIVDVASGTLDTILVHPREVFRHAIAANASAICLWHCHPSGQSDPSEADIKVTRDLIRAGQLLKIDVLDHVISGVPTTEHPKGYSSLREMGYFYA